MWWEKKNQQQSVPLEPPMEWPVPRKAPLATEASLPVQPVTPNPSTERLEKPMSDTLLKPSTTNPASQHQTFLGGSVTLRGELNGNEDLTIEGQFEGTLNLQDHCVTIGQHGQVKADITARQVVVSGKLNGKINAGEKIAAFRAGTRRRGKARVQRRSRRGPVLQKHPQALRLICHQGCPAPLNTTSPQALRARRAAGRPRAKGWSGCGSTCVISSAPISSIAVLFLPSLCKCYCSATRSFTLQT